MRILTRHLIRATLGPFLFALSALTGLLFLNAVAQRMESLAGKGLTWDVILDFLILSLPHTVALTLPMAVLVAVLYAFTEMTAANELTAMKAGGVPPHRIYMPLLVAGALMGAVMLYFNDRVLPESNHQLRNLLLDINRKSPTFFLREQVVNNVRAGETGRQYFISAARIDNSANRLEDVKIVDGSDLASRRITYADSGFMAFNEARTDLFLTLHDGVVLEMDNDRGPGVFQKVFFVKQVLPLRGVGNELERQVDSRSDRGDREMTLAMLAAEADSGKADIQRLRSGNRERTVDAVRVALGMPPADSVFQDVALARAGGNARIEAQLEAGRDPLTQRIMTSTRTSLSRLGAFRDSVHRHQVEYHKKWTLAVACIVFVLIGIPLAIRYPRGGLGLVIAASSGIFAVYWAGLIAGEDVADRGIMPPWLIMWVPNLLFGMLGVWMVKRMGREAATMRGGGWEDMWWSIKGIFRRSRRTRAEAEPA